MAETLQNMAQALEVQLYELPYKDEIFLRS
jgi:hypothetical protein